MDLRTLLNRVDIIENDQLIIKQYLSENLYSTPEMQPHWKKLDEGFIRGYERYIAEVALAPDQIQNIFKQAAGSGAGTAPKDPGMLAKVVDKVLPADQAANLEKSLPAPDAGAVQGFEEKAASAVQNLPGVDSSTKQSLMQWVKSGIKKPETQQLILAAVGAGIGGLISKVGPIISMIPGGGAVASAITGAVVAGAVAVASAKLQGKDWKTAFKGAIKPALLGGASAVIGNLATTAVSAMTSGSSNDTNQTPGSTPGTDGKSKIINTPSDFAGASLTVGQELPNGEGTITSMDSSKGPGGQVTITKPDGSTYTVDREMAHAMTGQTGISNQANMKGPVSMGATTGVDGEPLTPGDSGSKRGNSGWDSMKANTNPDGSPMTLDQINAAKDALRAGNATDMSGGNNPIEQPTIKVRGQPVDVPGGMSGVGALDPSIAPIGPNGQPMRAVPMDEPTIGKNFDAGIAPIGPNGQPMRAVPMDEPATGRMPGETPPGINRLTGKPFEPAPSWDQMTPDQQAAVTARQQQQAADAAQGAENAKQYWANKPANTRGLKESFAESKYVDKQATLHKWLVQESKGQRVHGLVLKPTVKEGIMDSLKGMMGGKKDAAPAAAGGVTADALNKAWTAAGSPTDSEEVAKVLQSAGVPAETVTKVFADLKLPAPGETPTPAPGGTTAPAPGETPTPGGTTAPPGAEPPPTPEAEKQSKVGVGQINKVIPTLRVRDLKSVQKNVDATLSKRQSGKQPTAEGKYQGFYSKFLGKEI